MSSHNNYFPESLALSASENAKFLAQKENLHTLVYSWCESGIKLWGIDILDQTRIKNNTASSKQVRDIMN